MNKLHQLFSKNIPQPAAGIPYLEDSNKDIFLFHIGIPSPQTFPHKSLLDIFNAPDFDWQTGLQYSPVAGHLALREAIADRYDINSSELMITAGIAESFHLLPQLFLQPHDVVFTETPSYPWGIRSFQIFGAHVEYIPTSANGMDTDALEAAIKRHGNKAKMIYTMPVFHNPLGISTNHATRLGMTDLAEKYNLVMVEDDPYRDLYFTKKPIPSMHNENPTRVINLGTFSKTIGGGVRLGWMHAHPEIIARLTQVKHTGSNTLNAMNVARFISTAEYTSHLNRLRDFYRDRRDAALQALQDNNMTDWLMSEPDGGFYLWLQIHPDIIPGRFYEKLKENDVFVLSGTFFGRDNLAPYFRLSYSYEDPEKITRGIARIAEVAEALRV
jgi:2-aminoadipate transaminase